MKLARHPRLDALCGEYLLGTLRGGARRRFERALRDEPYVAQRMSGWQAMVAIRPSRAVEVDPSAQVWERLTADLGLARAGAGARPAATSGATSGASWFARAGLWRAWALTATAAFAVMLGLRLFAPGADDAPTAPIATLAAASGTSPATVVAALTRDGATLVLHAARPVIAGPQQSYELWLVPAEGGAAISIGVLGSLDARVRVPDAQRPRLRAGAKLAVSVEPAGGSPTGAATGPIILVGAITG